MGWLVLHSAYVLAAPPLLYPELLCQPRSLTVAGEVYEEVPCGCPGVVCRSSDAPKFIDDPTK